MLCLYFLGESVNANSSKKFENLRIQNLMIMIEKGKIKKAIFLWTQTNLNLFII
jgi:hypothetical protein